MPSLREAIKEVISSTSLKLKEVSATSFALAQTSSRIFSKISYTMATNKLLSHPPYWLLSMSLYLSWEEESCALCTQGMSYSLIWSHWTLDFKEWSHNSTSIHRLTISESSSHLDMKDRKFSMLTPPKKLRFLATVNVWICARKSTASSFKRNCLISIPKKRSYLVIWQSWVMQGASFCSQWTKKVFSSRLTAFRRKSRNFQELVLQSIRMSFPQW